MPILKENHTIRVTDNSEINTHGRQNVSLNVWNVGPKWGKSLVLRDVLYIPDCGQNSLLSVLQLRMSNLFLDFHHDGSRVLRREGNKNSWIEAMEIDSLYILNTMLKRDDYYEKAEHRVMAVTTDKEAIRESALWHFRLTHLGVDAVRTLSKGENVIPTLPEVPRCMYTACVYRKMT